LKILALVSDAFGEFGGIAQYNRDLLSALSDFKRIREVIVLPRRTSVDPGELPARIRQLPSPKCKFNYIFASFQAAQKYRPFDLVFCGHLYMAPLARVIAWHLGIPVWIQLHGLEAWDELSPIYRRAAQDAALITSVSRYTRQRLLEWLDIDPVKIKVLANTVSPRFRPGPKAEYLLDRHNIRDKKILLTVSRLPKSDRYKGVDRVIRILPRVLCKHPDVVYLVAGDGDDRPSLELIASECGVSAKVKFLGQVSGEELPDYFRLADLFVMPSTGEGFGIVFVEAVASGIDAIGGSKDGSVDALGAGALGRTVDPDDPDELAAAVCASLEQPIRDSMRAQRFCFDKFCEHLEALLCRSF